MNPRTRSLVVVVLALSACHGSSAQPPPAPSTGSAAAASTAPSLDDRAPVPLTARMATHQKAEMRDHLLVVQQILAALAREDFEAIAAAASRIAWSEQQAAMCQHMGAGAPGFAETGERFHKTADSIVEAARAGDRVRVVASVDATLQTCVGCHAAYRQEIVDDASFAKLAGGMPTDCPMHGK